MFHSSPERRADLTGVVDMIVAVTFTGTLIVGMGAAIAGTLAGALGVAVCDRWGQAAGLIGGAVGMALVVGVVPATMIGPRRDWRVVTAGFLFVAIVAYMVADGLPDERDWRMLRWSVTAVACGVALGGLCDPIRFAGDFGLDADDPWFMVRIGQLVAALVKRVSVGRLAAVLAGVVAGAIGSVWIGFFLVEASRGLVEELAHGYWRVPLGVALLGATTGGVNGWLTWTRALQLAAGLDERLRS